MGRKGAALLRFGAGRERCRSFESFSVEFPPRSVLVSARVLVAPFFDLHSPCY